MCQKLLCVCITINIFDPHSWYRGKLRHGEIVRFVRGPKACRWWSLNKSQAANQGDLAAVLTTRQTENQLQSHMIVWWVPSLAHIVLQDSGDHIHSLSYPEFFVFTMWFPCVLVFLAAQSSNMTGYSPFVDDWVAFNFSPRNNTSKNTFASCISQLFL